MLFSLLLYSILLAVTYTDLRYKKIKDTYVALIFLLGLTAFFLEKPPVMTDRIIGVFLTPQLLIICNFIRKGSFGGGDLKLLSACGFFLGWKIAIVGLVIAILSCGFYCIFGILISRLNKKTVFAFGPFICLGMILADQWGEAIMNWYFT